jgi:hypothetical protein
MSFGVTGLSEAKNVAVFGFDPGDMIGAMDVSQCSLKSYLGVDADTRSVVVESVEAGGAAGGMGVVAHDVELIVKFQMLFSLEEKDEIEMKQGRDGLDGSYKNVVLMLEGVNSKHCTSA